MAKYANAYKDTLDEEIKVPVAEPNEKEPDDAEEASFKKRYGDLRRHLQQQLQAKDEELRKTKEQLDAATRKQIKFPKTEEEIAEWAAKYPDVCAIIDSIAQKRSLEALQIGEQKMASLQKLEAQIKREKAEAELLRLHPDFGEIRADKAFHEWVALQPKFIQDSLYENDTDAIAAARAIDLYKADVKKKGGRPSNKDAAQAVGRSSSAAPAGQPKGKFSESQVQKMSAREYEANEAAIMESVRNGTFIYDMTGAAR